jgi:hypothetical protein
MENPFALAQASRPAELLQEPLGTDQSFHLNRWWGFCLLLQLGEQLLEVVPLS